MPQLRFPTIAAGIGVSVSLLLLAMAWRDSGDSLANPPAANEIDDQSPTVTKLQTNWPAFQTAVQPFFAKHCCTCHGGKSEKGDVRLDTFQDEKSLANGVTTLEKARAVLAQHVMPPAKQPQPSDDERKAALSWLDAFFARIDAELPANPGQVVIRRLNRAEYNNTIRDLLGVHFQPADDFPADNSGHGFDNIGGALSVSPALIEKYLAAAEKVARTALFGVEPMQPERVAHQPFFSADAFSKNKVVKFDYDETGMSLPSALHVVQRFNVEADYKIRAILRGTKPPGSGPVHLAFWIDGKKVKEIDLETPKAGGGRNAGEMNGLWGEFSARVPAGEHWLSVSIQKMYEGLPTAYKGPNPSLTDGKTNIGVDAYFPMYLDVVGPFEQVKGPSEASLRKIFTVGNVKGQHDPKLARQIVTNLARRAYRRPATDKEIDDLVKLVVMVQKDGDSYEEGLCLAIQRMLISPHFLFRVENPPIKAAGGGKDVVPLSPHELASRLSYFLWSSMPDDELLRCADTQELRKPDVLEAQVRRMLKDPKAFALVENFGGQWLQTRALESHIPDRVRYNEFTEYTRMSMKKETDLFFEHIMREDRSVLDFIDGNYTFLNQRLADFYGIPGVKGHEFRKVDLTGTQRGGVWTQASVLTISSTGVRTSPVLRGKWILENLLNAPPPPPPPDATDLPTEEIDPALPWRVQLEKHRTDPRCAPCHARIDPLGFALDNFDAIGRWRDKDGKSPIDTSGTLPDGRSFKNHQELKAILKADAGAFAECLADKMLTYALGRGLERYDRKAVKGIVEATAKDDYRFSSLVLAIVQSVPFQMQKTNGAAP